MNTGTLPTTATADAVVIARLTRFAGDALDLADRRADFDLRLLVDDLHADLIQLQEDR
jgi:hypothetical protein